MLPANARAVVESELVIATAANEVLKVAAVNRQRVRIVRNRDACNTEGKRERN